MNQDLQPYGFGHYQKGQHESYSPVHSPHLTTNKCRRADWAEANNVEIAYTQTNSWDRTASCHGGECSVPGKFGGSSRPVSSMPEAATTTSPAR